MDESEEYEIKNNKTDNFSQNIDISNSDPIPSLLLPIKKIRKPLSLISHIISNKQNKNNNLIQVQLKINKFLTNYNLQKHNSSPEKKNLMLVDDLIESKETHYIAVFKDYLISDYQEEFLRRFFTFDEAIEVLPKFYQYYKNYLNFFCKGTFSDFYVNEVMQEYGECQAEFYYNRNYGHKDKNKKKDKKENIDVNGQGNKETNNNDYLENEMEKISNIDLFKLIFTQSIEYSIEKVKNSQNDIYYKSGNKKELSNIKPYNDSKEDTIALPDNSDVSSNDIITKENSLRYIINLMSKKKKRITLNKKIKNKKNEIIIKNNKNNENNNNKIINIPNNNKSNVNKNEIQKLSKTTKNLNVKNSKKMKISKSRNKSNSLKQNYLTSNNNNYKNKIIPSISNYKEYIDILSYKQKNKINKSSEHKIKIYQDDFTLSSPKITKNSKSRNIKSSNNNNNNIFGHFKVFSTNNYINNISGPKNKINSSLFLLQGNMPNYDKTYKNLHNYNTLFPLSFSKNNLSKKKFNSNKKYDKNIIRKSKTKDNNNNSNNNKYLYFNPNIKTFIKALKNVSSSPKKINNNINNNIINNNNNKTLSYSTVNNCNININNNIILSNNYYNSKQHQKITSIKKIFDKNIQKKYNINNIFKATTSRNNQNDINRFKTDVNLLNSIINQEANKKKININKNNNNYNNFKTFRKSINNEMLIKQQCLDINKKFNTNTNNNNKSHHHRNLSLKNIPITVRNNLYNKYNYTNNKISKLFDEFESNSISKTYKNLVLKKNNNSHQKKIIFDYKRK